jgi:antitoxin component YwqK of YwqJK toxin-antitoxin module
MLTNSLAKLATIFVLAAIFLPGCNTDSNKVKFSQLKFRNGHYFLDDVPFEGIAQKTMNKGKTIEEISFEKGLKQGEYSVLIKHNNASFISEKGHFERGKMNGLKTTYYKNGDKKSEEQFVNDQRNGLKTTWFRNGNKSLEVNFSDNLKEGLETTWYVDGNKKSINLDEAKKGKLKAGNYKISVFSKVDRQLMETSTVSYRAKKVPEEIKYLLTVGCLFLGFASYKKYLKL